ncbi:MAG: YggT family protein [Acidobacteriota bacterium]|nr:MAG: YggT family protein [Acidobacteriota bacterium]
MLWILYVLDRLVSLYIVIVLVRVLWSWTDHFPHNPLVRKAYRPPFVHVLRTLFRLVDPVVKPFRKFLPLGRGGMFLDVGPLILMLILILIQAFLRRLMLALDTSAGLGGPW